MARASLRRTVRRCHRSQYRCVVFSCSRVLLQSTFASIVPSFASSVVESFHVGKRDRRSESIKRYVLRGAEVHASTATEAPTIALRYLFSVKGSDVRPRWSVATTVHDACCAGLIFVSSNTCTCAWAVAS